MYSDQYLNSILITQEYSSIIDKDTPPELSCQYNHASGNLCMGKSAHWLELFGVLTKFVSKIFL